MNPRKIIADVARGYEGLRETSRNRGPHLDEFWKAAGYTSGERERLPWCSAFVSFCVQEADRRSQNIRFRKPPKFAAVAEWKPWAMRADVGAITFTPGDVRAGKLVPMAGDIVTFLPHLSHIGIVAKDYNFGGFVETTEGNTDAEGSREGDGVARKQRPFSFCGTFIRLPAVALPA